MALLFDPGIFSVVGLASELLVGAKLFWYQTGTSTPLATYSDQALTVPNTNPVIASADGRFPAIWLQEAEYKLVLKSSLDVTLVTRDPIIATNPLDPLAEPDGATLIGYGSDTVAEALDEITDDVADLQTFTTALTAARAAPDAAFSFLATRGLSVTGCRGPGLAELNTDLFDAWDTLYPLTIIPGGARFVAPWGSDANGGNTPGNAYLTLAKADTDAACDVVFVYAKPGGALYAPADRRYDTSAAPTVPRRFIGIGRPRIGYAGDDITAATFTSYGGAYPNVWKTQLTGTTQVERLLLTGLLDKYGEPTPMRLVAPESPANDAARDAMVAAIDISTFGWGWDGRGGQRWLYVRYSTADVNTVKTGLKAIYSPANRDGRVLLWSTTTYWEGFDFVGTYAYPLSAPGQAQTEAWFKDCSFFYPRGKGVQNEGAISLTQGVRVHRGTIDAAGIDQANSYMAYALEVDFETEASGDPATFDDTVSDPPQLQRWNPIAPSQINKQGSSNHNGAVIRVNGLHRGSAGQAIADTSTSKTWMLGTVAEGDSEATGGTSVVGIFMQSNAAWLDGCAGAGSDGGIYCDGATALVFNSSGTRITTGGGTISAWTPST